MEMALRFEAASGLRFYDKTLLQRALTHRSYINESRLFLEADNERLEFLGDAVIDFIVGEYLYHRFPEMREGALTNLRAALVREETLAIFGRELDLGRYLTLGRGESDSGGRDRSAILCAGFEALIGALFLDQDLDAVKELLFPLIEPVLPELAAAAAAKDAKSRLQEWSQSQFRSTPRYHTESEDGPEHAKLFTVQVIIKGQVWGVGHGKSKQSASQEAATDALRHVEAQQHQETILPPAAYQAGAFQDTHEPVDDASTA
jgi:ribonuclease-3